MRDALTGLINVGGVRFMARTRRQENAWTITVKEAAGLLGVSEPTLRKWDRLGKLPARRHPINGYHLYERGQVLALRAKMGRQRSVDVPHDFPNFSGDQAVAIVDTLIAKLFDHRALLGDPVWRANALGRIEEARTAIMPFGNAPKSRALRRELLVCALDRNAGLELPIDVRVRVVCLLISEALPDAKLDVEVVRDAVELWPAKRRKAARTRAIHALAQALRCDAPSLMTMLRAARRKRLERMVDARRN